MKRILVALITIITMFSLLAVSPAAADDNDNGRVNPTHRFVNDDKDDDDEEDDYDDDDDDKDDDRKKGKPVLLSPKKVDWLEGTDAWINLNWTTEADVSNIQVTAKSNDRTVTIEYPTNTPGYSSLLQDELLSAYEIDQTALFITTTQRSKSKIQIKLNISYTVDGRQKQDTHELQLRKVKWEGGEFYELATSEVTVPAQSPDAATGWVDLNFIGLAPELEQFQVRVETDLGVELPQEDHTSLYYDDQLVIGEQDVARIYVDPSQLTSGQQNKIELTVRFRVAGERQWQTQTHLIVLSAV